MATAGATPRFVLTDIDDTLTTNGRIRGAALSAMERLQAAGIACIPVTGRPAGWCDHIVRMWPVDGVVGENGAFFFRMDRDARRVVRRYAEPPETFAANRARLDALGEAVLSSVPGTRLASDQAYRLADIAIDFAEDVGPLDQAAIDAILAICAEYGATAKVSSIHVNVWFGDYDKAGMLFTLLDEAFGLDTEATKASAIYVGDSPNDEPLFRAFPWSVGVANIAAFLDRFEHLPRFVCSQAEGDGFVELVDRLLAGHG
ncbi:MAG: HAD-IIB family hydrolase [Rhodospirillales bacterium]|nr:HAD-IIB family hydrolase [Rhodospirillales bacterium]